MSVAVRGVVTLAVPDRFDFAVQDESGGIWVAAHNLAEVEPWDTLRRSLRAGQVVVVTGNLDSGGYAPRIVPNEIRIIGRQTVPPPMVAEVPRLFSGFDNCQRVKLTGVVQGVRDLGPQWGLIVSVATRRMLVRVSKRTLQTPPDGFVDAVVEFVGVVGAVRNSRGEFLRPALWVGELDDMKVVEVAPSSPFESPALPLDRIARYRAEPIADRRFHTEGVVTAAVPGHFFYLQQGLCGVRVQTTSPETLRPGDQVQVAGFVDMTRQIGGISDGIVQVVGVGTAPRPVATGPREIVEVNSEARRQGVIAKPSTYDGCLVRFRATLVESRPEVAGVGQIVLSSEDATVIASYEGEGFEAVGRLEPGSQLDVTGVIQIELLGDEGLGSLTADPIVQQLSLLLRSAADVQVVRRPSWWTPRRLALLLGSVAAGLTGALAWVWLLRSQVAATTKRLAAAMQSRRDAAVEFEATLRERNRLAANLHDTLLQTLTGIDFQLGACRATGNGSSAAPPPHLDIARKMVAHAAEELRSSVWALRTMPVAGRSFQESLEVVARQAEHGHQARIRVRVEGRAFDLPQFIAGNLLLVVQEAIHNAVRHSGADRIDIVAAFDSASGSIEVTVRDDGCGFTPGMQRGPDQGHFGLSGMRERIDRLGGTFAVESRPDGGTTVRAIVVIHDYDTRIGMEEPCGPAGA